MKSAPDNFKKSRKCWPRLAPPGQVLVRLALFGLMWAGKISFGAPDESPARTERAFMIDYRAKVPEADLMGFEEVVLQANVATDIPELKRRGIRTLAYLSLVEVSSMGPWAQKVKAQQIPTLGRNKAWKSTLADVTHPGWRDLVLAEAKSAMDLGFGGFFLDTIDSLLLLKDGAPGKQDAAIAATISLIHELRLRHPQAKLMINRGFQWLPQLKGHVDEVLVESVYQSGSPDGSYSATSASDSAALEKIIRDLRKENWPVTVVDYVPPTDAPLADGTVGKIRQLGARPFITTPDLHGVSVAPFRRSQRRLLVLHGSPRITPEDGPSFPVDTMTGERLQTTLEWLGYEVEFLDISKQSPPDRLDHRFGGVIFDAELELPYAGEPWWVDWTLKTVTRGLKVVFLGEYPFQQALERNRLFRGLGLQGTYGNIQQPRQPEIAQINRKVMNAEAKITLHAGEVYDLRAPEGASVDLAVKCLDDLGNRVVFDAVYTTLWGGALLNPYITFQASAEDIRSLFEPFIYLSRIFPEGKFPAPDPSTRQGQRVFFAQVDGDAFAGRTFFAGKTLCSEVVRDRIFKRYPLPVTASIIEAEISGVTQERDQAEAPRFQDLARSVFALPNVEPASHAFSHPYVWIDNDMEYIPQYETRWIPLRREAEYKTLDPVKETAGSCAYATTLCPPDKPCRMMLWSGNCRPGKAALMACRQAGIEDMNGGMTTYSHKRPGIAAVSPRVGLWDGQVQINCAMQNEFVYTNNWSGPFFGGFAQVVDTFERTNKPRRLKPVNVYYHFYSAVHLGALHALERVMNYCMEKPLHALTTRQFSEMSRDSYYSEVLSAGPGRWRLSSEGKIQTFRLPKTVGHPAVAQSAGVIGWSEFEEWIFIHTDGRRHVDLVVSTEPPSPHLHLRSSMAQLQFKSLQTASAEFRVFDFRKDASITLGGAAPGSRWKVLLRDPQEASLSHIDLPRKNLSSAPVQTLSVLAAADGTLTFATGGDVLAEVIPDSA